MERQFKYAEASQISGLSVGHLRNLAHLGKLRTVKDAATGMTLIPESALREHQEQAEKFTAPHLLKAMRDKQAKFKARPDLHLFGAIEVLNLFSEGAAGETSSPFLNFLSKHPELRLAVSQVMDAAVKDLAKQSRAVNSMSPEEKERWADVTKKANAFVRGVLAIAANQKGQLLQEIEQTAKHSK